MQLSILFTALIFLLFLFFLVIYILRKGKLSIKYSIVWFTAILVLFLFLLFPKLLNFLTNFFGFELQSNMLMSLIIATLFLISISLSIIVTSLNEKVRVLIQEVSILNSKVERIKK